MSPEPQRLVRIALLLLGTTGCAASVVPVEPGQLTGGSDHSCLVAANGTVWCWGWNFLGQLGTGLDGVELPRSSRPMVVRAGDGPIAGIVQAACGDVHCCALGSAGDVRCWGDNLTGALGTGSTELLDPSPGQALVPRAAIAIALGGAHSCALLDDGSLYCWGSNFFGQLGDGTMTNRFTPVASHAGSRFLGVASGGRHTCALDAIGQVLCWGDNAHGQLGRGFVSARGEPALVSTDRSFRQLRAGDAHTCAATAEGELFCWGSNDDGQLGIEGGDVAIPTRVGLASAVTSFDTGLRHTCAVPEDGSVWCWGSNGSHQVSLSDASSVRSPARAPLQRAVSQLALGSTHTCAAASAESVFCWGDGSRGQLGQEIPSSPSPVLVELGRTE